MRRRVQNQTFILTQPFQNTFSCAVELSLRLEEMRTGCESHLREPEAGACWADLRTEQLERRLLPPLHWNTLIERQCWTKQHDFH